MTNFKAKNNTLKLIDEILELTGEMSVRSLIDEPIEKALIDFNFEIEGPLTYKVFINYIGSFVRDLYKNLPLGPQIFSQDQACAEAISILETAYQGSNTRGFYAAFLDARNPLLNGIEFVLLKLSEIIKARLRMKYTRWVYVSRIECADWVTRCSMAEILLERWRPFLSPDILMCSPVQFADHIPELINMLGSSDNIISEMLGSNMNWISDEH